MKDISTAEAFILYYDGVAIYDKHGDLWQLGNDEAHAMDSDIRLSNLEYYEPFITKDDLNKIDIDECIDHIFEGPRDDISFLYKIYYKLSLIHDEDEDSDDMKKLKSYIQGVK